MGRRVLRLLSFGLVALGASAAAGAIDVFGLPLGGKLHKPVRVCKRFATAEASPCWSYAPNSGNDGTSGPLELPDAVLPAWAVGTAKQMKLARDGTVQSVELDLGRDCDFGKVRASIQTRFGSPTDSEPGPLPLQRFIWNVAGALVVISWAPGHDLCEASFESSDYAAKQKALTEEYREREKRRPATP